MDQVGNVGDWFYHVHHGVLAETLTEPLANRINYIRTGKPKHEIPVRLFLLRKATPPQALVDAQKAYDRADRIAGEVYDAFVKGTLPKASYHTARAKVTEAAQKLGLVKESINWNALHKTQCDPNCTWDGVTIFPKV